MEWLNLKTSALHSAEYIGADPHARATWLNVILWCVQQENGGRIGGAMQWKDRQWQQICGVTLREVLNADPLIRQDGEDMLVWNYPIEKESEVRAKREAGRATAGKRWGNREDDRSAISSGGSSPHSSEGSSPHSSAHSSADAEGKGREGKEMEGNGIQTSVAAAAPPGGRPRNLLFDALATATGEEPSGLTATAGKAIGSALAEIRKASPDVTPEEIHVRAENYRLHMPQATLTAHALKAHWGRCAKPPKARNTTIPWQRKTAAIDHSKGF
jgi:hypothetical protein